VFAPGPALGAVPPSFAAFAQAATGSEDTATWTAASGTTHVCRLVRPAPVAALPPPPAEAVPADDDFAPLTFAATAARNVSDLARAGEAPVAARDGSPERATARAIGALRAPAVAAGALSAGLSGELPSWRARAPAPRTRSATPRVPR
jgi:hypothetical protein